MKLTDKTFVLLLLLPATLFLAAFVGYPLFSSVERQLSRSQHLCAGRRRLRWFGQLRQGAVFGARARIGRKDPQLYANGSERRICFGLWGSAALQRHGAALGDLAHHLRFSADDPADRRRSALALHAHRQHRHRQSHPGILGHHRRFERYLLAGRSGYCAVLSGAAQYLADHVLRGASLVHPACRISLPS